MKEFFNNIKSDKTIFLGSVTSFLIALLTLLYTFIFYNHLPPFIPIYNQMPWGEARIAAKEFIYLPIAIIFAVIIVNLILSSFIYKNMPLISRILTITSLLVSFFDLLFIARTIQLII